MANSEDSNEARPLTELSTDQGVEVLLPSVWPSYPCGSAFFEVGQALATQSHTDQKSTRMGTTQIPEQPYFYLIPLARENLIQLQQLSEAEESNSIITLAALIW